MRRRQSSSCAPPSNTTCLKFRTGPTSPTWHQRHGRPLWKHTSRGTLNFVVSKGASLVASGLYRQTNCAYYFCHSINLPPALNGSNLCGCIVHIVALYLCTCPSSLSANTSHSTCDSFIRRAGLRCHTFTFAFYNFGHKPSMHFHI